MGSSRIRPRKLDPLISTGNRFTVKSSAAPKQPAKRSVGRSADRSVEAKASGGGGEKERGRKASRDITERDKSKGGFGSGQRVTMGVKLQVRVVEARDLLGKDMNGFSDPYVRIQVGASKAKTTVVHKNLDPYWNEEFLFNVEDPEKDVLSVSVWNEEFIKTSFLGQLKIPIREVADYAGASATALRWHKLEKRSERSRVNGDIRLGLALFGRVNNNSNNGQCSNMILDGVSPVRAGPSASLTPVSTSSAQETPSSSSSPDESDVSAASTDLESPSTVGLWSSLLSTPFSLARSISSLTPMPMISPKNVPASEEPAAGSWHRSRTVSSLEGSSSAISFSGPLSNGPLTPRCSVPTPTTPGVSGTPRGTSVSQQGASTSSAAKTVREGCSGEITSLRGSPLLCADSLPVFFDSHGATTELTVTNPRLLGDGGETMPPPLCGGVLIDRKYHISCRKMNGLLFSPVSEMLDEQRIAMQMRPIEDGPWQRTEDGCISRKVIYMTGAGSIVKPAKAVETQTYVKADTMGYVVNTSVITPDLPYGSTFAIDMQFCIFPMKAPAMAAPAGVVGSDSDAGGDMCRLRISWQSRFFQSSLVKGIIEKNTKVGLERTYEQFAEILSKYATPAKKRGGVDLFSASSAEDLGSQKTNPETTWDYLGLCFAIVSLMWLIFISAHISRVGSKSRQGLEFWGVDLPDSVLEFIYTAVTVLVTERVLFKVAALLHARSSKRPTWWQVHDSAVKTHEDSWLLTVTVLEAHSLPNASPHGFSDPYIVITCNGKTRTSSVKLQTLNPVWNEVLEFDAMADAPSVMSVEVFNYDGPFAEPLLLGRGEVNFLIRTPEERHDLWLPLQGRHARAANSVLRLRVSLGNSNENSGSALNPQVIEKVKQEVGAKLLKRNARKNGAFQKLFSVTENDFVINDFSCSVKRPIPLQGRLFLSVRALGFYSNIFGHKTKFLILWEDIEEVKENAPSINSINRLLNPSITMYIRHGRGLDAKAGSYGVDASGRLKIRFQSFVKPWSAFRIIHVLWKNRALPPELQLEKVAEEEARNDQKHRSEWDKQVSQQYHVIPNAIHSSMDSDRIG
ncbi:hypothetical protein CBR_g18909 [Chara braunii]|uniref:C2 domain-containing protein n=1 Tax=Chara braunii TaxID=69332 RepID=A0A388KWS4_CHABU|nr:hypothetical protein CBR_g18909 [Chara braunii]|eukprot:GBG74499.1 hypothetical protein CBR_g18909 [Chara braunii]